MSTLFDNDQDGSVGLEDDNQEVNYVEAIAVSLGKNPEELTLEDLAKKAFHADRHINRLENETDGLRNEMNKRLSLEEVMTEIKGLRQPVEASNVSSTTPHESSNKVEGLKEEDVMRLLQNERVKAIQDQNINQVRRDLEAAWGKGYRTKLKEIGTDLNLTEEDLGGLAARNPKAFMKLVGADVAPRGQPMPNSVLSPTSSIRPTTRTTPERTYDYYKKMAKENPSLYWDPKTRQQMYADLEKYGPEAFLKINQK